MISVYEGVLFCFAVSDISALWTPFLIAVEAALVAAVSYYLDVCKAVVVYLVINYYLAISANT